MDLSWAQRSRPEPGGRDPSQARPFSVEREACRLSEPPCLSPGSLFLYPSPDSAGKGHGRGLTKVSIPVLSSLSLKPVWGLGCGWASESNRRWGLNWQLHKPKGKGAPGCRWCGGMGSCGEGEGRCARSLCSGVWKAPSHLPSIVKATVTTVTKYWERVAETIQMYPLTA